MTETPASPFPPPPPGITLITSKTDRDVAADLRRRLTEVMIPVVEIMEEGRRAGLQLGFNIGPDAFGIVRLQGITVVKPL